MGTLTKQQFNVALDNALGFGSMPHHNIEPGLSNSERGGDCYQAVIDHPLPMVTARRLLEFFGGIADLGADPLRTLAEMVKTHKKTL